MPKAANGERRQTAHTAGLDIIEFYISRVQYSKIGDESGFSISKNDAQRIVQVWEDEERLDGVLRSGWPRVDSDCLIDAIGQDPEATLEHITEDPRFNMDMMGMSAWTAGRRYRGGGYWSYTECTEEIYKMLNNEAMRRRVDSVLDVDGEPTKY